MKKNILIITQYFFPAYKAGGPTKSIYNLVNTIKEKYNVFVICSNKDLGCIKSLNVKKIDKWYNVNGYSIIYCDKKSSALKEILLSRWCIKHDFLYLGSFFNPIFSIYTLMTRIFSKKSIIIAPKGEFFEGALAQKSLKKIIVLKFFKLSKIFFSIKWHATNKSEKNALKKLLNLKEKEVIISSNISTINKIESKHKIKYPGQLNVLICGRVSPIKNILMSLNIIFQLEGKINVEIWGAIDDINYWEKCLKKIHEAPKNVKVEYKGTFNPNEIKKVFRYQHVLLMPSLSENFGYSIIESLNFGIPVVISNNTPWRLLKNQGVGYDIPLCKTKSFVKALKFFEVMKFDDYIEVSKKCKSYAINYHNSNLKKNVDALTKEMFC